ncbi:MAG TPA: alpha/beta hydrolase [Herbaspirillum sp.]|jgi:pimeloyl-ACP methyl ester carboxylesterase
MQAFSENATVVLVHGAWADGSSWRNVVLPLQKEGLNVVCAPLPLTSLSADVAALRRVLARSEGPLLLVGHAYAGAVIGMMNLAQVKGLVYVAALAPDEGESVGQVFFRDEPHADAPQLAPDTDGFIWMPESGFAKAFAQNAAIDEMKIAAAVQRPIAVKCIEEPASAPAWKTKPSWYLIAEEDRMINPKTQRFMAERMGATIIVHDVDHTPSLTAPEVVIDLVRTAARETLANSVDSIHAK